MPLFVGRRHYDIRILEDRLYLTGKRPAPPCGSFTYSLTLQGTRGRVQNYETIGPCAGEETLLLISHSASPGIAGRGEILSNSRHIFLVVGVGMPVSFPR